MFALIAKASAKTVATFVVTLVFLLFVFIFAPGVMKFLQDVAEVIESAIRSPGFLDDRTVVLWRQFSGASIILGVIMTTIARVIVGVAIFLFRAIFLSSAND